MFVASVVVIQIPDMETGFDFRKDMYRLMGMTVPATPERRALLWLRPDYRGRYITNTPDLLSVLKKYDVPYT